VRDGRLGGRARGGEGTTAGRRPCLASREIDEGAAGWNGGLKSQKKIKFFLIYIKLLITIWTVEPFLYYVL
jgi:hypothetical protein